MLHCQRKVWDGCLRTLCRKQTRKYTDRDSKKSGGMMQRAYCGESDHELPYAHNLFSRSFCQKNCLYSRCDPNCCCAYGIAPYLGSYVSKALPNRTEHIQPVQTYWNPTSAHVLDSGLSHRRAKKPGQHKDGKVKAFKANPGSLDADDACKQEGTIRNWHSAQQRDINKTPVGPNRTVAAYWHRANCISSAESCVHGSAWGEQQGPEPSREGETDTGRAQKRSRAWGANPARLVGV